MSKQQKEEEVVEIDLDNVCPDFDDDCKDVKNHHDCFMGCFKTCTGERADLGTAQGYCPFIHTKN